MCVALPSALGVPLCLPFLPATHEHREMILDVSYAEAASHLQVCAMVTWNGQCCRDDAIPPEPGATDLGVKLVSNPNIVRVGDAEVRPYKEL